MTGRIGRLLRGTRTAWACEPAAWPTFPPDGETIGSGSQPVSRRRPRQGRAAPARRPPAPAEARRGGRPGPSARPRRRAHPHAVDALARLAGVLGPARHRQDHGGAALGAGDRSFLRADLRHLHRRRRLEEGVRGSAPAPRTGAGHAAVRRRDPPLQPRPAGQFPPGDGERHHRFGRRHHREPFVRIERAAAVARARAGVQVARCRGDREAAGARRTDRGPHAAARRRGAQRAHRHGRRRRPRRAHARRRGLARRPQGRDIRFRASCRRSCSGARRSTTSRRTAITISSPLCTSRCAAPIPTPRSIISRACSMPASRRSTSRAAWCAWRSRTSAWPTRRRW